MNPGEIYGSYFSYDLDHKLHSEEGPAVSIGSVLEWWVHGPAVIADGAEFYYLFGIQYPEEEYWKMISLLPFL